MAGLSHGDWWHRSSLSDRHEEALDEAHKRARLRVIAVARRSSDPAVREAVRDLNRAKRAIARVAKGTDPYLNALWEET